MSLYTEMTAAQWGELRAGTPMVLDTKDIERLRGINERVSMAEVEQIYLPLSRLLNLHVSAEHALHRVTSTFLKRDAPHVPFVIGVAGSVAVGKSTTARLLQALLSSWADHPSVSLIATDGFLYPNAVLSERGIMHRKGFPESYDVKHLIETLASIKAGRRNVSTPVYSHTAYDVLDDERLIIDQPDVVIVEGLNVLQTGRRPADGEAPRQFVSDFFDFSIYVDAEPDVIKRWFLDRFTVLRETAFRDEASHFHRYASMSSDEANAFASNIWDTINGPNLAENILPTRERASLILRKAANHAIHSVALRRR